MWDSIVGNAVLAEGAEQFLLIISLFSDYYSDCVSIREETFFYAQGCCFTNI